MTGVLAASNNGQALWYLTRGSGVVALLLLTASVLLGVANTTRWKASRWPRFIVYGLHRNVTLLALTFTVVHVLTTIVDSFAPIGVVDAFVPFLSPYRPFWLGLGAVAFDLLLALIVTSFFRRRIGTRAWRAVHWLAYASWPVAMLHSLGTGSDVHQGWLLFFGVACGATVLVAVLWRLLRSPGAQPAALAAALLGTLGVLIGLLVWTAEFPLQKGWAARAGTPSQLLAHTTRIQPRRTVAAAHVASLPSREFTASLHGRITEQQTERGLVVVSIDGSASGGFHGRLHVALRGFPLDGGGVQMTDSVVALLPTGAPAWSSGTVTALQGTRIESDLSSASRSVHVSIDLRIGPSSTFTGSLTGLPLS